MGCNNSKAAKVEDTYAAPEEGVKDNAPEAAGKKDGSTDKNTYVSGKEGSEKDLKTSAKDDSDWVPTIDTDIYNESGGGRIVAEEEVVDSTAQIAV